MERDIGKRVCLVCTKISTHTLTWSVTYKKFKSKNPYNRNFNSHAHVERDIIIILLLHCTIISTHTLTWSVTLGLLMTIFFFCMISTHTLTWSVTSYEILVYWTHDISTHTLTWSVT